MVIQEGWFAVKKLLKTIKDTYSKLYASLAFKEINDQAVRGHSNAELSLTIMYETGTAAVKQDLVAAIIYIIWQQRRGSLKLKTDCVH